MSKNVIYILAAIVMFAVAVIYWPVTHASFVWDDWQSFRDKPWLTQDDLWKHAIFSGFNDFSFYFRPLVIAFFTLQVRLFDSTPSPMHAVSLAIHLVNVALVGMLSWQCARLNEYSPKVQTWMTALCMTIYGLHPALIEPVAWIGCQFDLITTMLITFGLLMNIWISQKLTRAATLVVIFFLAACSKESAIAFPLLILIFDWIFINRVQIDSNQKRAILSTLDAMIRRNGAAYAGILLSGLLYLFFRHWALGSITNSLPPSPMPLFARLQLIGFVYLHYWKIILWPVSGMSPIHPFDRQTFTIFSASSVASTVLAFGIFVAALYAGIRRNHAWACIIIAVTLALFPVLQIIPVQFEVSLYHERYATTALAVLCSMLPLVRWPDRSLSQSGKLIVLLTSTSAIFLWLSFSIVTIRTILPRWSNDVTLWGWARTMSPESSQAKDYLLIAYMRNKDFGAASSLADEFLTERDVCLSCMIQVAKIAETNNDTRRATLALERLSTDPYLKSNDGAPMRLIYYQLKARLLIQENKLDDAEKVTQMAVALKPTDTNSQDLLSKILALKEQATQSH
jgi:hypothetical protein